MADQGVVDFFCVCVCVCVCTLVKLSVRQEKSVHIIIVKGLTGI